MPNNPITFWYGPVQRFGHLGQPQRWINVLGNVANPEQLDTATFSINGGADQLLALGGDLHRLAQAGDFNVELAWKEVDMGTNLTDQKTSRPYTPPATTPLFWATLPTLKHK